ncbi:hypothetical protein ACFOEE_09550 [Pseudoalteromonas fenneropenaei]|uniref:Uncharacterized protein n=1 Tax=Pseudoalteromonas fenneropenaei TaxID=1737459 RepID=A0ABV7CJR2_9GAMM
MKKNSKPNGSYYSGFMSIIIGGALMVLNCSIFLGGEYHMRQNSLSADGDLLLFSLKLLTSALASLFFIISGLKVILTKFKDKDDNEK